MRSGLLGVALGLLAAPPQGGPDVGGPLEFKLEKPPTTYLMWVPEDYKSPHSRPAAILCHGAGDTPQNFLPCWIPEAKKHGWILVAGKSKAEGWSDSDAETVLAIHDDARRRYALDPDRTFVVGNSSGAFFVSGFGIRNHARFRGMALCAGAQVSAGGKDLSAARGHMVALFTAGEFDPYLPGVKQTHEKFKKDGWDTEYLMVRGQGHSPLDPQVYAWVFQKLDARTKGPAEHVARARRAVAERRWADAFEALKGCRVQDPAIAREADALDKKLAQAGKKAIADAVAKAKKDPAGAVADLARVSEQFDGTPVAEEAKAKAREIAG
ncbi:MAG: hypothetical protein L0216_04230 [Planctomycetales bacterium]|nr:hypothetical protein [Planctomycetales bacterium]